MEAAIVDTGVSYGILGPLTVTRGGAPVDLGAPKQRAVLGLLLLHRGRVVSTDTLVDAVWGEAPPPSALPSLQAYVSNLRRALRDEADATTPIVRRAPGYVIDVDPARLDVATFTAAAEAARAAAADHEWDAALEAADRALGAWRGPLLEDVWTETAAPVEAAQLEDLRTACRETRVTARLATGATGPALAEAAALHADHPLRDGACWLHVIALHRAGRSSEALDAYRAHVDRLDAELGLEPGAELRELQVAILRHDPVLAAWPRRPGWTAATLDTPVAEPVAVPEEDARLVGRERELGVIDAALADARAGRTRWLLLTGEAGIGKTRLAEEATRRGGREVWARCPEDEGMPAGWPIRLLVRALGEDPDTVLVPPAEADSDSARFAIYERVAALIERVATPEAPVVLVVDDVQWADTGSARCLAYLVGALRNVPVLAVFTLRDGEDRTALEPVLTALARSDGLRQLAVGPLAPDEVGRLAGRVAGTTLDELEAGRLAARTGGNPLFVCEYARLDPEERGGLPLAVRAVVGRRLAALDEPVLEVLRAAAVIGDALDVGLLAATTGLDPDALADRLDDAADESVIAATPDTGSYAFAHGLLREQVLAGIPAMRRQRLEGRVARALEDRTDGDSVIRRAQHLLAALPLADGPIVLDACRAAARVAEERWASDAAAQWWASAIRVLDSLPPTPRGAQEREALLVARVDALARVGRGATIVATIDDAILDAARDGRPGTAGRYAGALLRSAGAWPWLTAYGEHAGPLIERLDNVQLLVDGDPAARVAVLAARAVGHCGDVDLALCERLSTQALAEADALGEPGAQADAQLGRLLSFSGVATHAAETVELCGRLAGSDSTDNDAVAAAIVCMAHFQLGDVDAAAAAVQRGIAVSDRLRMVVTRLQLRWAEGALAIWRGDVETARARSALAGRVQAGSEFDYPGSYALAESAIARLSGELATADPAAWPEPGPWLAAIAVARGERERAAGLVREWLHAPRPVIWLTAAHVALAADVVADLGLVDEVDGLLDWLAPYAGQIAIVGHVGVIDPVDLITGRLHAAAGRPDVARELIAGALAHAERTGGTQFVPRCRAALGGLA